MIRRIEEPQSRLQRDGTFVNIIVLGTQLGHIQELTGNVPSDIFRGPLFTPRHFRSQNVDRASKVGGIRNSRHKNRGIQIIVGLP
ncbi:hypothetical protein [Streptomyces sp. AK04-3B]|uniref:hypothetical protein n=1 Tax=Streptomyces sp. AK04-3B TaxID=3028650 RepID=UPI0029A49B71|nr:hypothetical protein [Streptomyces sp. AK04-3B]MDX3802404.1 hypothetical protein [Streptomyces sp. AK04-3B]